jgi:GTP diphosphokinase / guanosine-3',5'-bis(diphosphate) 3'-diphosphatase
VVYHTRMNTQDLSSVTRELWKHFSPHISYLSKEDREVVELAFLQMVEAHNHQKRKSGDFYIVHPVEAAIILAKMKLDVDSICACLMHDVPEDTEVTLKDLEKAFNKEIVFLVFGITKLGKIKYQGIDRYAENLRKMFVAMSKDLRVVFIKLADRLHNLQTLEHLPPEKSKRIALESLEIYVPIAQRLGMNSLKSQIEDAAFPFAYPDEYQEFSRISKIEIEKRKDLVGKLVEKTQGILNSDYEGNSIVVGRAKKYYSLYKKYLEKGSFDAIHDLIALRIIVPRIEDCYTVLSIIHNHFQRIDGRLKDYIEKPKENGYRSLHTTVMDSNLDCVVEFQIRTEEMNEFAEYGVASHWSYKARDQKDAGRFLEPENLKWVSELVELGREDISHEEYLKHVKLDLYNDRIFVLTPKNDVIDLPKGASPLDFAYKIHEKIGSHAVFAKVNDNPMKLSGELKDGDVVEILTDKKQVPKADWLGWVKTSQAAKHIRTRLRKKT